MATHRPGTVLSPRRTAGYSTPPRHLLGTPSLPPSPVIEHRPLSVPRMRPRSTVSTAAVISGGILSAVASLSAWGGATLVVEGADTQEVLRSALRAGASFSMCTPFMVLVVRCCALAIRKGRVQLGLGFAMPPAVDVHAAFELYLMGILAFVLGVYVPVTALLGHFMGIMLSNLSATSGVLSFALMVPLVYVGAGVCLGQLAPVEGFAPNTRPRKLMWVALLMGHVAILWSCFYSPDVYAVLGFALGFVHLGRLLDIVFSFPGSCEDGIAGPDTDVE